jgi:TatD DNase family protein
MKIVDSHCHLDDKQFDEDREAVIERALEAGVTTMLAVGTGNGPPDLEAGIRLAESHESIYASVGVHPHDAQKANGATFRRLKDLFAHPKVVAVGEIGLDYHYDFSPRERQREVFVEQLRLAEDAGKPVIIHTREAWADTIALLEEHWDADALGGIMHCFSGDGDEARLAVDMGFHVSFAGIVTFPKAHGVQDAAKWVPSSRLLVETDCPYLAPVPNRGRRNEPAFTIDTARKVAELRGESLEEIARITTENFNRLCLPAANISE